MDKISIRKKHLEIRKNLDCESASRKIVSKISELSLFRDSDNILIYYPLKYEINLLELVKNFQDKKFYFPKVFEGEILVCPYDGSFKKGAFNILEPCSSPVLNLSVINLAFVPALAVDKNLYRVGYGGGYYDRLLSEKEFRAKTIVPLYRELLVEKIETEKFDLPVDYVITD